jgi:hypothetical protein
VPVPGIPFSVRPLSRRFRRGPPGYPRPPHLRRGRARDRSRRWDCHSGCRLDQRTGLSAAAYRPLQPGWPSASGGAAVAGEADTASTPTVETPASRTPTRDMRTSPSCTADGACADCRSRSDDARRLLCSAHAWTFRNLGATVAPAPRVKASRNKLHATATGRGKRPGPTRTAVARGADLRFDADSTLRSNAVLTFIPGEYAAATPDRARGEPRSPTTAATSPTAMPPAPPGSYAGSRLSATESNSHRSNRAAEREQCQEHHSARVVVPAVAGSNPVAHPANHDRPFGGRSRRDNGGTISALRGLRGDTRALKNRALEPN